METSSQDRKVSIVKDVYDDGFNRCREFLILFSGFTVAVKPFSNKYFVFELHRKDSQG